MAAAALSRLALSIPTHPHGHRIAKAVDIMRKERVDDILLVL